MTYSFWGFTFDIPLAVSAFLVTFLMILVIRIWPRSQDQLLSKADFTVAFLLGAIAIMLVPLFRDLHLRFGFDSDVDGLILASISILFTVLTYVTMASAAEVREISEKNKKSFQETNNELIRFRAHLQVLSQLRDRERLAEVDPQKEIEVRHLETLYKLFGTEEECTETLKLLRLADKKSTVGYISSVGEYLREYILVLPKIYPDNEAIKTSISELRRLL